MGDRGPWLLAICVLEYVQYILSAEAMCTKSRPDFSIDLVEMYYVNGTIDVYLYLP